MHIPRIYTSQPLSENSNVQLDTAASHHISRVLRMQEGRQLILFNGQGGEFAATISEVKKKSVSVKLGQWIDRVTESPLKLELGVGIIKSDRMDWLIQKATELGVTAITPLFSEYTDVKLSADRAEKKLNHWTQIVINACEQSGRTAIPAVAEPQKLSTWLDTVEAEEKLVLHPYKLANNRGIDNGNSIPKSLALLVGPEGGLSASEADLAINLGFSSLILGPRILRAETAPLAALTLLQYQYGDYKK